MKKSQNRGRRDDGRNTVNKQRRAAAKSAEAAPGQGSSGAAAEPPLKWLEAWLEPEMVKAAQDRTTADKCRLIDFVTAAVSHYCWQSDRLRETCGGPDGGFMVHAPLSSLEYARVLKASGGGNCTEFTRKCVLEAVEKAEAAEGNTATATVSDEARALFSYFLTQTRETSAVLFLRCLRFFFVQKKPRSRVVRELRAQRISLKNSLGSFCRWLI